MYYLQRSRKSEYLSSICVENSVDNNRPCYRFKSAKLLDIIRYILCWIII